jgi:hypothetical protein
MKYNAKLVKCGIGRVYMYSVVTRVMEYLLIV